MGTFSCLGGIVSTSSIWISLEIICLESELNFFRLLSSCRRLYSSTCQTPWRRERLLEPISTSSAVPPIQGGSTNVWKENICISMISNTVTSNCTIIHVRAGPKETRHFLEICSPAKSAKCVNTETFEGAVMILAPKWLGWRRSH